MEQIRSAADLVGIDTLTQVKRISSAGVAETQRNGHIEWKLRVRQMSSNTLSTFLLLDSEGKLAQFSFSMFNLAEMSNIS